MKTWLALVSALVVAFILFLCETMTPPIVPADASSTRFSASRAMKDVAAIGYTAHPLGSPQNQDVVAYLVKRMAELGLNPQVQRTTGYESSEEEIHGGTVQNVIGILPGRNRSIPALALVAHHDTVVGSPGASDDTAGVATALEVVRALKAGKQPERDVMIVITDGEEEGLVGAHAFYGHSDLAKHIGYAINMDTRGGGGRAMMFETASGNGADIALYRHTAALPLSNSLTVYVYQHIPNDSDFTVAKQSGIDGLNYAFIGLQFDYHSPTSTPTALDQGSLQNLGAEILPTARALADGPLPGRMPDVVYANLLGGITAAYPPWFGWVLVLLAGVCLATALGVARQRQALAVPGILRGLGVSFYTLAIAGTFLELFRRATGVGTGWMAYRPLLARFPLFEFMMFAAALGAVIVAAALTTYGGRSRWAALGLALLSGLASSLFGGLDVVGIALGVFAAGLATFSFGVQLRLPESWAGMQIATFLVATIVQILAPLTAYVLIWPLLVVTLLTLAGLAGTVSSRSPRGWTTVIYVVAGGGTLAWLAVLFHQLLQGIDAPVALAIPTWLAALIILPLVVYGDSKARPLVAAGVFITVAGLVTAWLHLTSPWSTRYPDSVEPVYLEDMDSGRAWRASLIEPNAWARRALLSEGRSLVKLPFTFEPHPILAAAAQPVPVPAPIVQVKIDDAEHVSISSKLHVGAARLVVTFHSSSPVDGVILNGEPVVEAPKFNKPTAFSLAAGQQGYILWSAPDGFVLTLHTANPGSLKVEAAEIYDRWLDKEPLPSLPRDNQMWSMAGSSWIVSHPVPQ
jgi:hypothetical protein